MASAKMKKLTPQVYLGSIRIDNLSFSMAIKAIEKLIILNANSYVVTPNVDHIVKLQKDEDFKKIYNQANLVLADGMPLIWASHFLKCPLIERITGSDLFPHLCEISAVKGYKIFLLGGRDGAAEGAKQNLEKKYPGIRIVDTYCPYFGFESDIHENQKIVERIKAASPDLLFVGLGAPKGEKWIYRYKDLYQAPVSLSVGVSIEFLAGMVKRAPVWMQKGGLEWAWRLMMEPQKLWKRYLVDDLAFFKLILKEKLIRDKES